MPDPALPVDPASTPATTVAPGLFPLHREYHDLLGRKVKSGKLTVYGTRPNLGVTTVVPSGVNVDLIDGTLHVLLPPDRYTVTGFVTNVDGGRAFIRESVELTGQEDS